MAASPAEQHFRLLDLPAELRLRVYDYLLSETLVSGFIKPQFQTLRGYCCEPALMQSSRQIRSEAESTLMNHIKLEFQRLDTTPGPQRDWTPMSSHKRKALHDAWCDVVHRKQGLLDLYQRLSDFWAPRAPKQNLLKRIEVWQTSHSEGVLWEARDKRQATLSS